MANTKYVAFDVHSATIYAVVYNGVGKCVMESVIETKTKTIRDFIKGITGRVVVTFEQGTQSAWLYDLIKPLVSEVIVCDPHHNKLVSGRGNKSDRIDTHKLATLLLQGGLKAVYQGQSGTRSLKEYVANYEALVADTVRVMNRIKGMFRARGISCGGTDVYKSSHRDAWLSHLNGAVGIRAASLYRQLDFLKELRKEAKSLMMTESQKHKAARILRRIPDLGPVWVAQILATAATPHRFRTKRHFWAYCGLAVVTRTTSDYEFKNGRPQRRVKKSSCRGLNHNYSRRLKNVFKAAAIHSISHDGPFRSFYAGLLAKKMKPEMARLTLARKIASITLSIWKREERFDPNRLLGNANNPKKS